MTHVLNFMNGFISRERRRRPAALKVLPPLVAFFKKIGKSHITHPDPGHRFTARAGPAGMGLQTCVKVVCDLLPF